MPTDDLFELQDPSRSAADPRVRQVRMVEQEQTGPARIADPEEMIRIFTETIERDMPSEDKRRAYKEAGHRIRIEDGEFPITSIVGAVSPNLFRWMVSQSLDKNNEGSYFHTITREQYNGVWVPTACAIRRAVVPKMDVKREVKRAPMEGASALDGIPQYEQVGIATHVLQYRIVWTDAVGNRDLRFDIQGKAINDTSVAVHTTTDPALLAILTAQAEATAKLSAALTKQAEAPVADVAPETPPETVALTEHQRLVAEGKAKAQAQRARE